MQADDAGTQGHATEPEAKPEQEPAAPEAVAPYAAHDDAPNVEEDRPEPPPEQEPAAPDCVAPYTEDGLPDEEKVHEEVEHNDDGNHTEARIGAAYRASVESSCAFCFKGPSEHEAQELHTLAHWMPALHEHLM